MVKTTKTAVTKTLAELEAEREALRDQIRAARRAERKAAAAALADAQTALGRRLAEAVGATSPEAVERLWAVLDLDHVRAALAAPAPVQTRTTAEAPASPFEAGEGDHAGPDDWSS